MMVLAMAALLLLPSTGPVPDVAGDAAAACAYATMLDDRTNQPNRVEQTGVCAYAPLAVVAFGGPTLAGEALCIAAFESSGNPRLVNTAPNAPRFGVAGLMQIAVDNLGGPTRHQALEHWGRWYLFDPALVEYLLRPLVNLHAAAAIRAHSDSWAEWESARLCGLG